MTIKKKSERAGLFFDTTGISGLMESNPKWKKASLDNKPRVCWSGRSEPLRADECSSRNIYTSTIMQSLPYIWQ